MIYAKIAVNGSGFTNQIISLICSIINAIECCNRVVVIEHFLNDYLKETYTPISQIINIIEFNDFLQKKYGIIVIDKIVSKIHLISARYGTDESSIDVTKEIKQSFLFNERFFISKYVDFTKIMGDPCVGKRKTLDLQYLVTMNLTECDKPCNVTYKLQYNYPELLTDNIVIDISNSEYIFYFSDLQNIRNNPYHFAIFEDILTHIQYSTQLSNSSLITTRKLNKSNRINYVHLRVEPDAITHWSKKNGMEYNAFQQKLESTYIKLIQKYMNPLDDIIILSNSAINGVIDFLLRNNYKVLIPEKCFKEREKNAIVDLLVSKKCNHVFLGCINNQILNGSTYSYYISKIIDKTVMKVGIDIDFINNSECVFY